MSKKDYELIARYIKDTDHNDGEAVIKAVASALSDGYKGSYSFDRDRFMRACGVDYGGSV